MTNSPKADKLFDALSVISRTILFPIENAVVTRSYSTNKFSPVWLPRMFYYFTYKMSWVLFIIEFTNDWLLSSEYKRLLCLFIFFLFVGYISMHSDDPDYLPSLFLSPHSILPFYFYIPSMH